MPESLSPGLEKELIAARAALTTHGVVIIRTIETELEPAVMAAVRRTIASSSRELSKLDDRALDKLMDDARKAIGKSVTDLERLYTRLLAKLGNEDILELASELEGIDQLFKWERILRATDGVEAVLAEMGFGPADLSGPDDLSDAFKVELTERWPMALGRLRELAAEARDELSEKSNATEEQRPEKTARRRKR